MAVSQPRYSKEEFARRGDEIYEHDIRPHVEAGHEGKFVVIDIETGAYCRVQDYPIIIYCTGTCNGYADNS